MQYTNFTDLFELVQSLAGVDAFTPVESARMVGLINRRLYEAYNSTPSWPRYAVVGEERTLTSNLVAFTQSAKDTISDFQRIHKTQPFVSFSAVEYEFYVDSSGAHILNNVDTSASTAWVTYKKIWDGPFDIASTTVPQEFYYYAAHAAYADFLRMDGQIDKAVAEETIAASYLATEIAKAESQRNNNIISRRISTHNSRQFRA